MTNRQRLGASAGGAARGRGRRMKERAAQPVSAVRRRLLAIAAIALIGAMIACSHNPSPDVDDDQDDRRDPIPVHVRNENF
ncbi:MAG TPA: hypothetical protein VHV78_17420, partial [Gemmatimonadaceae bacterium]|nr:hypothetical protein [Gemmatimonadaceae bacterium]